MSRVGRKPIKVLDGIKVEIANDLVEVAGPKGKLSKPVPSGIYVKMDDGQIHVERKNDEKKFRSLHGLIRALIQNMIVGVKDGFTKSLDIVGIGYRAELAGANAIKFNLGYSHPLEFALPEGVSATIEDRGTKIIIHGIDKEVVGETAARIKRLRIPDSYKGKGIRYAGESLRLKAGKAGVKK